MIGCQLSRQHLIEKWLFWLHSRSSDNNPRLFIWIVWKICKLLCFRQSQFSRPLEAEKNPFNSPLWSRLFDRLFNVLPTFISMIFHRSTLIPMTLWLPTSTQAELLGPPIWWYKQERDKYLVRFLVKLRAPFPLFSSIQTELPRKYPRPPTKLNLPSSS